MSGADYSDLVDLKNFGFVSTGSGATNVTELVRHTLGLLENAYPGALNGWAIEQAANAVLEVHVGRREVVAPIFDAVSNVLPAWVELRVLLVDDVEARRRREGEAELARIGAVVEELGR